jgi:hypothetical protein
MTPSATSQALRRRVLLARLGRRAKAGADRESRAPLYGEDETLRTA